MTETVLTDPLSGEILKCDVCNDRGSISVASIPGIPVSCAWCRPCVQSGAIPYWALVANTGMIGGLDGAADWWKETVDTTLRWLGKTMEEFLHDVQSDIDAEQEFEAELREVTDEE